MVGAAVGVIARGDGRDLRLRAAVIHGDWRAEEKRRRFFWKAAGLYTEESGGSGKSQPDQLTRLL
jgi:hypothetical protein